MKKKKMAKLIKTLQDENMILKNKMNALHNLSIEVFLSESVCICQSNKMNGPMFMFRKMEHKEDSRRAIIDVFIP